MTAGFVYILKNEAMPGLVKIGKTTRSVESRINELNTTGVPFPFQIYFSAYCPNCHEVEAMVHKTLSQCRVNQSREFFLCDPLVAEDVVINCHREEVENWLEMYLPDHSPVEANACVDIGYIHARTGFDGIYWMDIAQILEEATAEELRPAMLRVIDRRKKDKKERVVSE